MSRSYKKTPGFTDYSRYRCLSKKFANKAVRNYKGEIPDGGAYKKLFQSLDICDYKFLYYSKREVEMELEDWYSFILKKVMKEDKTQIYRYYMK